MQPLIDADVLVYEIGFGCEWGWKKEHPDEIVPWHMVQETLDLRIQQICQAVGATMPPMLFLTGKGNFREVIAKRKGYKANRAEKKKPYHAQNIIVYLKGEYGARTINGMEADDAICIEATKRPDETVVCTRDKDLRQCPGWHYGWECGKQGEFHLQKVDEHGWLRLTYSKAKQPVAKLEGAGNMFLYAQMLMGDSVDNIPGLPKVGPKKAHEMLHRASDELELYDIVHREYSRVYGDRADAELLEQAKLVYMLREVKDGAPVWWTPPHSPLRRPAGSLVRGDEA